MVRIRHATEAALFLLFVALTIPSRTVSAGIDDLRGTQPGELHSGGKFLGADGCSQCHGGGFKGDTSYLPFDTWAGTMMANAARDPVFLAALAVANQDDPGVGTFCIRCHSPIAFVRGHATPPDANALDEVDRQGIGCEACHRAAQSPAPDDPYLLGDAQLVYTDDTAKHGPYRDSISPSHTSVLDTGLADARFCGQCHQVTNPERHLRDALGTDTGIKFPLDTTYEEWASSEHARPGATYAGCIDCHMLRKSGALPVATPLDAPLRQGPRDHTLTGGNHWGILAVMKAAPERAAAHPTAFENALARTLETLKSAVRVTIVKAPERVMVKAPFEVTLRVENLSGHKFPAGYAESRRAWIALSLVNGSGIERGLLGGYNAATGEIQAEPKTHVYRAQHGRWSGSGGEPEEHIALHDMVISDTRIPPKGFIPSITTMPSLDINFKDDAVGYRSYDEATFTLALLDGTDGPHTLSARVYYQSMTRDHIEFLRTENTTNSAGEEVHAIYEATNRAPPILIASADVPVSVGAAQGSGGVGGKGGGSGVEEAASSTSSEGAGAGGGTQDRGNCDCGTLLPTAPGGSNLVLPGAALLYLATRARRRTCEERRARARAYWSRKPSAGRRRAA